MNDEFEKQLQRQPLREVPGEWRSGILAAAAASDHVSPARAKSAGFMHRLSRGIRSWLWPNQRAWAGLAVAWAFILLLHFTNPDDARQDRNFSTMIFPSMNLMPQQAMMMTLLSDSWDRGEAPAAMPAAPKPRSDRPRKQLVG